MYMHIILAISIYIVFFITGKHVIFSPKMHFLIEVPTNLPRAKRVYFEHSTTMKFKSGAVQ